MGFSSFTMIAFPPFFSTSSHHQIAKFSNSCLSSYYFAWKQCTNQIDCSRMMVMVVIVFIVAMFVGVVGVVETQDLASL